MISCNMSKTKKEESTKIKKVKIKNVMTFNIEKQCSFCHDLPKFSEKTDSYIKDVLLEHNKARKIRLKKEEFKALVKEIQKRTK